MAGNNWLLYVGGAIIAYKALQYSKAHDKQVAKNLQIKIAGVHADKDAIVMDFNVLNPNSQSLSFKSLVGSLMSNGVKIADLKMFGDYVVQGNSELKIPVQAVPKVALIQQLFSQLQVGKANMSFNGVVNVNNAAIPLTLNYTTI